MWKKIRGGFAKNAKKYINTKQVLLLYYKNKEIESFHQSRKRREKYNTDEEYRNR